MGKPQKRCLSSATANSPPRVDLKNSESSGSQPHCLRSTSSHHQRVRRTLKARDPKDLGPAEMFVRDSMNTRSLSMYFRLAVVVASVISFLCLRMGRI